MKFRFRPFYFATLFLALSLPQAHALVSSEVTLSSGYYQDYEGEHQVPVFLYWTLNYTGKSGVEAYFDMGFNNQLLIDQWGYFLYQAYVTVPFSQGFASAPYRRSRIQVGRQFLSDGFELTLLDGVQLPVYWSQNGGANLIAGGSYAIDEKRFDFSSRLYGGTLHQKILGAKWQAGYFQKQRRFEAENDGDAESSASEGLAHASLFKSYEDTFLKPSFLLKGQWKLSGAQNEGLSDLYQGYGELLVTPLNTVTLGTSYSKRKPSELDPAETTFVYRLFAVSPQKTASGFITWSPNQDLRFSTKFRRTQFDSPEKLETANEQELDISWLHGKSSWMPSIFRLKSYGGEVWQPALAYRHSLSDAAGLRAEVAAAHIEKLNGIESWAYHSRAGVDVRLAPRLLTLALVEVERNHRFELDARAVAFLTYYLF